MNFVSIVKQVAKAGPKVVDAAAVLGVPGMAQLDAVVDAIKNSSAKDHEKEAAIARVDILKSLPVLQDDSGPIGPWDSKRFQMTAGGILAIIGVNVLVSFNWMQPDAANEITYMIGGLTGLYNASETLRASGGK